MKIQTKNFNAGHGFSIACTTEYNDQGEVVSISFDVFNSGKLLKSFKSLDEAKSFVERYKSEPPSP